MATFKEIGKKLKEKNVKYEINPVEEIPYKRYKVITAASIR